MAILGRSYQTIKKRPLSFSKVWISDESIFKTRIVPTAEVRVFIANAKSNLRVTV